MYYYYVLLGISPNAAIMSELYRKGIKINVVEICNIEKYMYKSFFLTPCHPVNGKVIFFQRFARLMAT